jgi:hypothetical protein
MRWAALSGRGLLDSRSIQDTLGALDLTSIDMDRRGGGETAERLSGEAVEEVGVYSVKLALRDFGRLAYMEAWMLSNSGRMFVRGGSHLIG